MLIGKRGGFKLLQESIFFWFWLILDGVLLVRNRILFEVYLLETNLLLETILLETILLLVSNFLALAFARFETYSSI